ETMLRSWYGDVVPNKMNLAMGWYNAVTGRDSAGRVVSPEGVSCLEGSNYFPYFRVMRNSMNSNRDGKDTATPPCLEQLAKSEGGDIRQARFKPPDKCLSSGGTWRDFVNQIAAAAKLRSYSAKYNYKSPVDQKDHTGWRIGGVMTLIDILARQFDSNAVKADSPLSSIEFGVGCGGK
ncbi:MAG: hypothetical protein FWD57_10340, partial [Polyangiaceae bacterium]|nr:hypothetical protein [Polyangiaceae bacterium]